MKINSSDPRITAYVFGELEPAERQSFEQELHGSAELQELVEQTRKAISLIETDLSAAPETRLRPEQREAVVSSMSRPDASGPAPLPAANGRSVWPLLAVAATLLVVAGVALTAQQGWRRSQVTMESQRAGRAAQSASEEASAASEFVERSDEAEMLDLSTDGGISESPPLQQRSLRRMEYAPSGADSVKALPQAADMPGPGGPAAGAMPVPSSPEPSSRPFAAPLTPAPASEATAPGEAPAEAKSAATNLQVQLAERRAMPAASRSSVPPRRPGGDANDRNAIIEAAGPGDRFEAFTENAFIDVLDKPRSTFSIDVDTASYSKVRQILNSGRLPPADAVRLEELINYFPYRYASPDDETPFASHLAVSACPWNPEHRLVRIAMKAKELGAQDRPTANLVFLVDVSGSMGGGNRLPLLKRGLQRMTRALRDDDRIAIVTYAGRAGVYLDSTPGSQRQTVIDALGQLSSGGSTNGGAGIQLAYDVARRNFIENGVNRVILCSDGDFNVGRTGTGELVKTVEREAKSKIAITVLGFGMGNHNDAMMEQISNHGNGNYAFIDNDAEADKVLIEQLNGTLVTVAKDVKIQVNFNHRFIESYRMLGYENRKLRNRDFHDDTKDAGEIGAGHAVTMLYEVAPASSSGNAAAPQPPLETRRQTARSKYFAEEHADSDELLELSIRYKMPDEDQSTLMKFPLPRGAEIAFGQADQDFRFAAAVASFGMLLRDSQHQGDTSYDAVLEIAQESAGDNALRLELLQLIRQAKAISGPGSP